MKKKLAKYVQFQVFGAISQAKTNHILSEEPARITQLNTKISLYEWRLRTLSWKVTFPFFDLPHKQRIELQYNDQ